METRICDVCRKEFPLTTEFFYSGKNDKNIYFRRQCKKCFNKKAYRKKNSKKFVCKDCEKAVDSLNEEGFCITCEEEIRLYKLRVQEIYQREEEKEAKEKEWMIEAEKKRYICKECEEEKSFNDMRITPKAKRVSKICKLCYKEKRKEYTANYEARIFAEALAKATQLKKETSVKRRESKNEHTK